MPARRYLLAGRMPIRGMPEYNRVWRCMPGCGTFLWCVRDTCEVLYLFGVSMQGHTREGWGMSCFVPQLDISICQNTCYRPSTCLGFWKGVTTDRSKIFGIVLQYAKVSQSKVHWQNAPTCRPWYRCGTAPSARRGISAKPMNKISASASICYNPCKAVHPPKKKKLIKKAPLSAN